MEPIILGPNGEALDDKENLEGAVPVGGMKYPRMMGISIVLVSKLAQTPEHFLLTIVPYETFSKLVRPIQTPQGVTFDFTDKGFLISSIVEGYVRDRVLAGKEEYLEKTPEEIAEEIDRLYAVAVGGVVPADVVLTVGVEGEENDGGASEGATAEAPEPGE